MIHRALANRLAVVHRAGTSGFRQVHKGVEATPPMRFMSMPERFGLYFFIAFSFLSYPTYVMLNLNNLRPKPDNFLNDDALAERERRIAARR
uniref:Uncharacterized protein n=1 Tax=Panagrolaimus superbus TaxID=310955 RepID=A0A914YZX6_9BILA